MSKTKKAPSNTARIKKLKAKLESHIDEHGDTEYLYDDAMTSDLAHEEYCVRLLLLSEIAKLEAIDRYRH